MVTYATMDGIPYCGLTDGDTWILYDVFQQKPMDEKELLHIQISKAPVHEAALALMILWKPNIRQGPPAQAKTSVLQEHEPIDEQEWSSPKDFDLSRGNPKRIRFPDGEEKTLGAARHAVTETATWLTQNGHLKDEQLPVRFGRKRNLVLQLQKCGEEFQAASVMAAPGRCLVPPSPPGPPQH